MRPMQGAKDKQKSGYIQYLINNALRKPPQRNMGPGDSPSSQSHVPEKELQKTNSNPNDWRNDREKPRL